MLKNLSIKPNLLALSASAVCFAQPALAHYDFTHHQHAQQLPALLLLAAAAFAVVGGVALLRRNLRKVKGEVRHDA